METNLKIVPTPVAEAAQIVKTSRRRRVAKAIVPKAMSARMVRRQKLQYCVATVIALVAAGMTAVSLQHIAGTFEHQTHIADWQAWLMAGGIDVNYVGMEMAGVVAAMQHTRDKLHKFTRFGIPSVMAFSMACNVLEFTASASDLKMLITGWAAGLMLPIGVWLGFRIAAILAEV